MMLPAYAKLKWEKLHNYVSPLSMNRDDSCTDKPWLEETAEWQLGAVMYIYCHTITPNDESLICVVCIMVVVIVYHSVDHFRLNIRHLCVCFISVGETERYKWVHLLWNLVAAYISLKTVRYELDIRGRRGIGETKWCRSWLWEMCSIILCNNLRLT